MQRLKKAIELLVVVACFDRFQPRIGALGEVRDEWLQGRDLLRNKTIIIIIIIRQKGFYIANL
jgi:hypothetical protein